MFWALVQVAGALPEGQAVQAGQQVQEQEQPEGQASGQAASKVDVQQQQAARWMWVGAELAGRMVGLLPPVVRRKYLPDCWGPFLLSMWNLSTNQKPGYSGSLQPTVAQGLGRPMKLVKFLPDLGQHSTFSSHI
jgi:hypothetical protein